MLVGCLMADPVTASAFLPTSRINPVYKRSIFDAQALSAHAVADQPGRYWLWTNLFRQVANERGQIVIRHKKIASKTPPLKQAAAARKSARSNLQRVWRE